MNAGERGQPLLGLCAELADVWFAEILEGPVGLGLDVAGEEGVVVGLREGLVGEEAEGIGLRCPFAAGLFDAGFVARSSQIRVDMLVARASPASKISCRKRARI